MGGACSTYLGKGEVYTKFWWENLMRRYHLEDLGVDGDNIKMVLQEMGWEHNGMD
jgi:hypothetical protein